MLAGAEGLAGWDHIVTQAGLIERRMLGRVDMKAPGADRFEPGLAGGQPIGFGQLLGGELRRGPGEQCSQRGLVGLRRFARQPRFKLPVVGAVLSHFAPGQHNFVIPVGGIFVGQQRPFDHRARGIGDQFPAHLGAVSLARRLASRSRPAWA